MRRTLVALVCLLAVVLSACSSESVPVTTEPTSVEPVKFDYPYDLSLYVKMGDPEAVTATFADPTVCTEGELNTAILQVRLTNATYAEKEGAAELYDRVVFDFDFYYEDVLQKEFCRTDYPLVLGNASNPELEALLSEALLGAVAGDEREVQYTYPDVVSSGSWKGKTIRAVAKVKRVDQHTLPAWDDAFAQAIEGADFESIEELNEELKQDILTQKERAMVSAVWLEFLKTVEVIQYPQRELNAYRQDYRSYFENMAAQQKMSLEEYLVSYMGTDLNGFEREMETYSKELCRNDMVFIRLAEHFQIELTDQMYQEGLQDIYSLASGPFSSLEEYEAYYGTEQLRRDVTYQYALLAMAEKATRLDPK